MTASRRDRQAGPEGSSEPLGAGRTPVAAAEWPPALGDFGLWSSLLDSLSCAVGVSRAGSLLCASPAWARLCGMAGADELRDKSVEALFADTGEGLPGADSLAPVECGLVGADGEWRRVRVRVARANRETSEPDAEILLWGIEDVSPLRRVEEELGQLGRDLLRANREREALRERSRLDSAEREELLSVVSHELRTPVTVISGYSRLLLSEEVGPLNPEQRRFLSESGKSCQRLNHFIGNLLEASRHNRGEEALDLGEASLEATITGVVRFLRPLLEEREIQVELRLDPDALWARFDAVRIEQVLTNLIGNAIQYGGGQCISIETAPLRAAGLRFVEVSISDDGPGIAPEQRDRIFESYVRGDDERKAGGLGLGLAICRRLVEAHGGRVQVADARPPRRGSRFSFTLCAPAGSEEQRSVVDSCRGGERS